MFFMSMIEKGNKTCYNREAKRALLGEEGNSFLINIFAPEKM